MQTTLYRPGHAIALADAFERFPTLTQTAPHHSRSERYAFTSTAVTLEALVNSGLEVHGIQTQRLNPKSDKVGFEKHLITLRAPQNHNIMRVMNDVVPEITFMNSHDGTRANNLWAGVFRIACLNGIVAGNMVAGIKVNHSGNAPKKIVDAAHDIISIFTPMLEAKTKMEHRTLARGEIMEFTLNAARLAFDADETAVNGGAPFNPLLLADRARRSVDLGDNLWNVFNRVQENLMKGGLHGWRQEANYGRGRNVTTRGISAIDRGVRVNRGLWDLAAQYIDETPRPLAAIEYAAA